MKQRKCFIRALVLLAAVIILAAGQQAAAQQDVPLSQLAFHRYAVNPAMGGIGNLLQLTAHARAQWVGVHGNPLVQYLTAHAPVRMLHGGAGIAIRNELMGAMRLTGASVSYNYQLPIGPGVFSAGLAAGMAQAGLQGDKLRAPDGNYASGIDHQDPILSSHAASGAAPDLAAGIGLVHPRFLIGLSMQNILQQIIRLNGTDRLASYQHKRQYYGQLGVNVSLSKTIMLEPVAQVRWSASSLQAEAGATLFFRSQFWIGAGLRGYNEQTADAFMAWAGLQLNPALRMGYAYDYPRSALRQVSQGSHELFIAYGLQLLRPAMPGKTIFNTRF